MKRDELDELVAAEARKIAERELRAVRRMISRKLRELHQGDDVREPDDMEEED